MEDCKMAMKNGGSKYNQGAPFFRVDSEFDKNFKL